MTELVSMILGALAAAAYVAFINWLERRRQREFARRFWGSPHDP